MTDASDLGDPNSLNTLRADDDGDAAAEGEVERAAAAPPGEHEAGESFSGSETVAGVAEELRDKPT